MLTKTQWAKLAGLKPYHVTRCFEADRQLLELFRIVNEVEGVLKFGRRRMAEDAGFPLDSYHFGHIISPTRGISAGQLFISRISRQE